MKTFLLLIGRFYEGDGRARVSPKFYSPHVERSHHELVKVLSCRVPEAHIRNTPDPFDFAQGRLIGTEVPQDYGEAGDLLKK